MAKSGALRAILATVLVTVGFLPAAREIVPAAGTACDCTAGAACPLRGLAGACTSTCRHGGGRPDGWNADCGCRHPGPPGSVAGRELPALPASTLAVRIVPVIPRFEVPESPRPAGCPRAPEAPPPRG